MALQPAAAMLLLGFTLQIAAQPNEPAELFDGSEEVLQIVLTGPWSAIAREKSTAPEYRSATLALPTGELFELDVRPRGKSRRKKEFCAFPPLQLNFRKHTVKGSLFDQQNKLKLVTHCGRLGTQSPRYSDQLHSEYLLYRIFNDITDMSFRVQPLNISWVDSANNSTYAHPGFLIEHKKTLTKRLKATEIERSSISLSELDAEYTALSALFAYFAGNTDFSFTSSAAESLCCHNALPVSTGSPLRVFSIPYDFDSTGFVSPAYAKPVPGLGISQVSQRIHRGYCAHSAAVPAAIERFIAAREQIVNRIKGFPHISERRRKKLLRYTEAFYSALTDDQQRQRNLLERCR